MSRRFFERAVAGGYLDTAAEGLAAPGMDAAMGEYFREKRQGTPGREKHFAKEEEARGLAARLLGTGSSQVAFAPTTSDALNLLAASMPFTQGDEVVITDLEFPSNVLPWLALERRGVKTIVVPSRDGALDLSDLANALSARTRLVSISLVSYKSGAYFPHVQELADRVHGCGGVLCVDATQALGRCPVPLDGVDYLMASSFKWLLGPHGLAIVYLSPSFRQGFELAGVGWYSVANVFAPDRFERYSLKPGAACISAGMPNFPALYGMCESLRFLLPVNSAEEQARVNSLSVRLRQDLRARGLRMLTPQDPALASGIVSFEHEHAAAVGEALAREGIIAWAGDGRVRASLHFYNDERDTTMYLNALDTVLQSLGAGSATQKWSRRTLTEPRL
jgi:selenocysteine lyase/cysteine desulfurase